MTNKHPDEREIQDYCLDMDSNKEVAEHIAHCEACSAKVVQYKLLFTAVHQQKHPTFEFTLSQLVMAQLPVKPNTSFDKYLNQGIIGALAIVSLLMIYFLSPVFSNALSVVPKIAIYLSCTIVVCISSVLLLDTYRKYREKVKMINFY